MSDNTSYLVSEINSEAMSTCQVDVVRMDAGQATPTSIQQQFVPTGLGGEQMAQGGGGALGVEVSIKMLMSSKVSIKVALASWSKHIDMVCI